MKAEAKKVAERKGAVVKPTMQRARSREAVWPIEAIRAIKHRDFSDIENHRDAIAIIGSIARYAVKSAASEAIALRMARTYALRDKVIKETADGKKIVIETAQDRPNKRYFKKYTLGTVMHAVKK